MPPRLAPTATVISTGNLAKSEQLSPFATSTISVFLVAIDSGVPVVIMSLETVEQNKRIHNSEVFTLQCIINKVNPEITTTEFL